MAIDMNPRSASPASLLRSSPWSPVAAVAATAAAAAAAAAALKPESDASNVGASISGEESMTDSPSVLLHPRTIGGQC